MAPPVFNAHTAREALEAMGGSVLFEKVLTSSDANGSGRLVIPKSQAEQHFPYLEQQQGMTLHLTDTEGKQHSFRFRFWINNQSRMYLLENTGEVQAKYRMQAGDVLVFAKLQDGNYCICGRKGTKDDVSRKPAVRRAATGASTDTSPQGGEGGGSGKGSGKRSRRAPALETSKSKRMRQKQAAQAVQSLFTYWSGYSLPMKRDGVFRAVPNSAAAQEGDRVVAQFGAWSAIVSVGGELFQAFFDTYEAANAALDAALQSAGRTGDDAPTPGGAPPATRGRSASAEPVAGEPSVRTSPAPTAGTGGSPPGHPPVDSAETGPGSAASPAVQQQQQQQQQQQPSLAEQQALEQPTSQQQLAQPAAVLPMVA